MTRLLIVVATEAEAAHVPDGLQVLVTGIGKTAAAAATAHTLAETDRAGLRVVNIGTAGALHDGLTGLHVPGTVLNHDMNADAIRALGYDPREVLRVGDGDLVLASGDVFVSDPVVRASLASRAHLVDMEGYAVAHACDRFDIPVTLVKHVSDNADESALDWPAVVDRSAQVLGAWLRDNL